MKKQGKVDAGPSVTKVPFAPAERPTFQHRLLPWSIGRSPVTGHRGHPLHPDCNFRMIDDMNGNVDEFDEMNNIAFEPVTCRC